MASQCIGFQFNNDDGCKQNPYRDKNLFEDENYEAILDRLNGGLPDSMAFIQSMEKYRDRRSETADQDISYFTNSMSGLERLSLSNYGTTKKVQCDTHQMLVKQAQVMKDSCKLIGSVIDEYKQQVDMMYPKRRLHKIKHYRADEIEGRFITARKPFKKVLDRLNELDDKKRKANKAINKDPVALQERDVTSTTNEKVNKLRQIEKDIADEEVKRSTEEAAYIERARLIFQECQKLEEERLDQIKQTLLKFIQAIHPSHYEPALSENFKTLKLTVEREQSSAKDVAQWAQIHHIDTRTPSETNANNNITTIPNDEN